MSKFEDKLKFYRNHFQVSENMMDDQREEREEEEIEKTDDEIRGITLKQKKEELDDLKRKEINGKRY